MIAQWPSIRKIVSSNPSAKCEPMVFAELDSQGKREEENSKARLISLREHANMARLESGNNDYIGYLLRSDPPKICETAPHISCAAPRGW